MFKIILILVSLTSLNAFSSTKFLCRLPHSLLKTCFVAGNEYEVSIFCAKDTNILKNISLDLPVTEVEMWNDYRIKTLRAENEEGSFEIRKTPDTLFPIFRAHLKIKIKNKVFIFKHKRLRCIG